MFIDISNHIEKKLQCFRSTSQNLVIISSHVVGTVKALSLLKHSEWILAAGSFQLLRYID